MLTFPPAGVTNYEFVSCNYCGLNNTVSLFGHKQLVKCCNCGLIYVNPRPVQSEVFARYGENYYQTKSPEYGGYEDYWDDLAPNAKTSRKRISHIEKLLSGTGRLLDVGCAGGFFMRAAKERGWDAYGIDVSKYAIKRARTEWNDRVQETDLAGFKTPPGTFDVITFWDVLEHVCDPLSNLRSAFFLLKPGGIVAISTPDAGSLPARLLGEKWLGFRCLEEHNYYFSRRTLRKMLVKAGFTVVAIKSVGKFMRVEQVWRRLCFYTRIARLIPEWWLSAVSNLMIYAKAFDTMAAYAKRPPSRSAQKIDSP